MDAAEENRALREQTEHLLQLVAIQREVARLSTRFAKAGYDSLRAEILNALHTLCELNRVERAYIFLLTPTGDAIADVLEWVTEGVEKHPLEQMQGVSVEAFPWSMQQFLRGDVVHVTDPDALPAEAAAERGACETMSILSYVNLPMFCEGQLYGWLGFDACVRAKSWGDEVALLQIVGDLVMSALVRMRRQAAQRAEADRARFLFAAVADAVLVVDRETLVVTDANAAADTLYGRPVAGAPLAELAPAGDELPLEAALLHQTHVRADGSPVEVDVTVRSFVMADRPCSSVVVRDAHPRKSLQAAQVARARAEASDVSKTQFLATLSHELRTPLHSVSLALELLQQQLGQLPGSGSASAEVASLVTTASSSSKMALSLVGDMLDLSRVDRGTGLALTVAPVPVREALARAAAVAAPVLAASSLTLQSSVADDVPATVEADALRLDQILLNLLRNAAAFSPAGARVELYAAVRGGCVAVGVRDSGAGIAPDMLERIFAPFVGVPVPGVDSAGLGLYISKDLAQRMGATLTAHSTVGAGATFELLFPLAEPRPVALDDLAELRAVPAEAGAEAGAGAEAEAEPETETDMDAELLPARGTRVLVVDDNELCRRMEAAVLTQCFHDLEVVEAADGEAALALAREQPFHLVLMDVHMPGMGGIAAARAIGELPGGGPPVVGLTASPVEQVGADARAAGMRDVAQKPLRVAQLVELVGAYTRKRKR